MKEAPPHLLPQAERLLRRIDGVDLPLVELWGWPGSGTAAVLQELLARPDVAGLALADLAAEETARLALAAPGVRRLVVAGDPAAYLDDLANWLQPGHQLVFASRRRRMAGPVPAALLSPQELLLTAAEVSRLWYLVCGHQPPAEAVQALWQASDGWYRPLRMALEATGGAGLEAATAEMLLELAPVRLFLRHQVLDALPATERAQLLAADRERPYAAEARDGAAGAGHGGDAGGDGWQLVDELGYWVEGGDRDRLPALLAACLDRERRRRRSLTETDAERGDGGGDDGAEARGTARAGAGHPRDVAARRPGGETATERHLRPAAEAPVRSPSAGADRPAAGGGGAAGAPHVASARGAAGARGAADEIGEGSATPQAYHVRLFGGPSVRLMAAEGEREVGWKLRRSFQVLAFLASSPDLQAGREDLEEAVWPSDGEHTIDRNFHPTLSHLRRALERQRRGVAAPPLLFRAGIYRLNPEIDWHIDLQEFNARVAEGRALAARGEDGAAADTWQRAWKLYRGPFLQGYYQTWVTARREECQQAYVELLREIGDLSVRLDRSEDALDSYRAVLLEDPLQERTHLAVMRLYAGQGRRDLVRRQYERLCTLLLDELGVEPLPETVQEYHRLMS